MLPVELPEDEEASSPTIVTATCWEEIVLRRSYLDHERSFIAYSTHFSSTAESAALV